MTRPSPYACVFVLYVLVSCVDHYFMLVPLLFSQTQKILMFGAQHKQEVPADLLKDLWRPCPLEPLKMGIGCVTEKCLPALLYK